MKMSPEQSFTVHHAKIKTVIQQLLSYTTCRHHTDTLVYFNLQLYPQLMSFYTVSIIYTERIHVALKYGKMVQVLDTYLH